MFRISLNCNWIRLPTTLRLLPNLLKLSRGRLIKFSKILFIFMASLAITWSILKIPVASSHGIASWKAIKILVSGTPTSSSLKLTSSFSDFKIKFWRICWRWKARWIEGFHFVQPLRRQLPWILGSESDMLQPFFLRMNVPQWRKASLRMFSVLYDPFRYHRAPIFLEQIVKGSWSYLGHDRTCRMTPLRAIL